MIRWTPIQARLDRLVFWIFAQIGYSVGSALAAFLIAVAVSVALKHEGQTLHICLGVCS